MQALQHGAAGPRRYSEAPSGLHCPAGIPLIISRPIARFVPDGLRFAQAPRASILQNWRREHAPSRTSSHYPDRLLDAIKIAVASAVTQAHEQAQRERPYWFRHILMRCGVEADKIAEQAAQAQYSDGEATYVEVYAKTLPTLLTAALDAHEEALEQLDGSRLGQRRPRQRHARPLGPHVRGCNST